MIDRFRVVRIKRLKPDGCRVEDFGKRTDFLVLRPGHQRPPGQVACWEYPDGGWPQWNEYFGKFSRFPKYSHGLAAAFMIMEHLKPERIYTIGCDRLMGQYDTGKCFETPISRRPKPPPEHDWEGEHKCLLSLSLIIDLSLELKVNRV